VFELERLRARLVGHRLWARRQRLGVEVEYHLWRLGLVGVDRTVALRARVGRLAGLSSVHVVRDLLESAPVVRGGLDALGALGAGGAGGGRGGLGVGGGVAAVLPACIVVAVGRLAAAVAVAGGAHRCTLDELVEEGDRAADALGADGGALAHLLLCVRVGANRASVVLCGSALRSLSLLPPTAFSAPSGGSELNLSNGTC